MNDIFCYIEENYKDIETDMINTQRDNQQKKQQSQNIKIKMVPTDNGYITQKRKRRNELSKSYLKNMNKYEESTIITFD